MMASACVNNVSVSSSQEFANYGCFNPRASFSREDGAGSVAKEETVSSQEFVTYGCFNPRASFSREDGAGCVAKEEIAGGAGDFEFRLDEDPVRMLPADELFSDGKLVTKQTTVEMGGGKCRKTEVAEMEISDSFSPKAPRCSSRWRDLLGLKRFSQNSKTVTTSNPRTSTSSLKQFLNRSSRSSSSSASDASLLMNLPLLKDSDSESISISSSRMSLSSSSSSGHDHEDLPRLSLDAIADRPNHNNHHHNLTANPFAPSRSQNPNPPRMRLVNNHSSTGTSRIGRSPMRRSGGGGETTSQSATMNRGVSVDSPRLNSSGKIVFERSSSSPSSFNGGTSGYRHRGMERSYSSNVRVTPVLNVPVCSIRGGSVVFGQFFSNTNNNNNRSSHHINRGRISTDRV